MAVMRSMLEAGLGTGLLAAASVSFQKQEMCRNVPVPFASYVLVITRWQLSPLFHFYSCVMLMQMSDYPPLSCYSESLHSLPKVWLLHCCPVGSK